MKKLFDDEMRRRHEDDEEYKKRLMQRERDAKGTEDNRMNPGETDEFFIRLQEFEALQALQAEKRQAEKKDKQMNYKQKIRQLMGQKNMSE